MVGVACVHATKLNLAMTTVVVTGSVDLPSVREDVGKSTLDAKFAISLEVMPIWSVSTVQGTSQRSSTYF